MDKQVVAAFDFDGTITTKDTLLEFIRFAKGTPKFVMGFILYSPLLVAYKFKLYPNWKVKQQIFSYFFKGMSLSDFDVICKDFCKEYQHLIREGARKAISDHIKRGDSLVIISASVENWVYPFAERLGISDVLCTKLEIDDSACLTGRFASKNCYGEEKVNRLLELFADRNSYYLIAYGDSGGDKALLDFADEKYYRRFS